MDKAFEVNLSDLEWITVLCVGENYLSGSSLQHSVNLRLCYSNDDLKKRSVCSDVLTTCPLESPVQIIFCLKALSQNSILATLAVNLEKSAVHSQVELEKEHVSLC